MHDVTRRLTVSWQLVPGLHDVYACVLLADNANIQFRNICSKRTTNNSTVRWALIGYCHSLVCLSVSLSVCDYYVLCLNHCNHCDLSTLRELQAAGMDRLRSVGRFASDISTPPPHSSPFSDILSPRLEHSPGEKRKFKKKTGTNPYSLWLEPIYFYQVCTC